MFIESTTNLLYEQYSYGQNGLVDSLRAILMTLHSKTNAMPKCCCDSNFVLLFSYCFKYY